MSKKIEMKELSLKTKIGETAYWTSLSGEVCVGGSIRDFRRNIFG
jgi:hypothetical protein